MTQRTLKRQHTSWSPLLDWCERCARLTSSQSSYTLRLMKDSRLVFQDSDLRISTTTTVLFTLKISRSGQARSISPSLLSSFPATTFWRRPLSMRLSLHRSFNWRKREPSLKSVFTLIQERSSALRCFLRTLTLSKSLSMTWIATSNSIYSISVIARLTSTKSSTDQVKMKISSETCEAQPPPIINELHY